MLENTKLDCEHQRNEDAVSHSQSGGSCPKSNKSNEAIVHVLAMCRDCFIKSHLTSCRSVRAAISSGFRWIAHAVNRSLCSKGIIITGLSFGKGKPD